MEDLEKELDSLLDEGNGNGNGNPPNPGNGTPKLPEPVKQVITKLREDRRQLREKVAVLENDPRLKTPQTPPTPPVATPPQDDRVDKLTFAQQNPNLDYEDVEKVFALAKAFGKTPTDSLEDPMFKAYKADKDAKKHVQNATPPPSNRSGVQLPEGKQMKDLTDAERREMQEKLLKEKRNK